MRRSRRTDDYVDQESRVEDRSVGVKQGEVSILFRYVLRSGILKGCEERQK